MVASGPNNSDIYHNSDNCGKCYRVKCTHEACTHEGVTVTVTDICRRALPCLQDPSAAHFDMSGHAFGAMAVPGRADELRAAGLVTVEYEWIDCEYSPPASNPNVVYPAFLVHPSSSVEDFAITVMYIEGMAIRTMTRVQVKNAGDSEWQEMDMSLDVPATWTFTDDSGRRPLHAPLSVRVIISWVNDDQPRPTTITAEDVIPVGWQPGHTYYNIHQ